MNSTARAILKTISSLRLTVALIAISIVLIFAATLDQRFHGIWHIVNVYFRSFLVRIELNVFVPAEVDLSGWLPWPGGYAIGPLMLLNLLAAHLTRFKLTWRRSGIILIHSALILLLVGEAITGAMALETQMPIYEGQTVSWSHDVRQVELAVIDHGDPGHDRVVTVPAAILQGKGEQIRHAHLPFEIRVERFMSNSRLEARPRSNDSLQGLGRHFDLNEVAIATGVDEQTVDYPSALVSLWAQQRLLGRYLLSPQFTPAIMMQTLHHVGREHDLTLIQQQDPMDQVSVVGQPVSVGKQTYHLYLRFRRHYKPSPSQAYSIHLVDFSHDRYTGTNTPKGFSSRIELNDPLRREQRSVQISMNHPLRYQGETFFQASWLGHDRGTVLQIVENPAWQMPYVACLLGALGLLVHFGIHLIQFLGKPRARAIKVACPRQPARLLPWATAVVCLVWLIWLARPPQYDGPYALGAIAQLPVSYKGRVKPIDTVARNCLMLLNNKQTFQPTGLRWQHLKDGPGLHQAIDAQRRAPIASPGKHLWLLMDQTQRDRFEALVPSRPAGQQELLDLLNELMGLDAFHDPAAWAAIADDAVTDGGRQRRSKADTLRDRRLLLAAAFPQLVGGGDRARPEPAISWLLEVLCRPEVAAGHELVRIDHPEVLTLLDLNGLGKTRFAAADIATRLPQLHEQYRRIEQVPAKQRDAYQRHLVQLMNQMSIYNTLSSFRDLHMLPPVDANHDWMTMAEARQHQQQHGAPPAGATEWSAMLYAYHVGNPDLFNRTLAEYDPKINTPAENRKATVERLFNHHAPFYRCMLLYVIAALAIFLSWLHWRDPLQRTAWALLLVTFLVHSLALAVRVYLSGRPPVTNLYSSAVFIGWGGVLICLLMEVCYHNGIGALLAAATGSLTLLVAKALEGSGDTMAVLQAVLDTNFWLATHVVVVTLGYAATFMAGFLAVAYILRGLLTRGLGESEHREMGRMIYGTVCFALLFSFSGTVLGGIWADQSWGRFWGWDPKENGAILIVLWNALILHARWCGLVRQRGMANLAVFGNVVTSWSWFGTNMLGVGLHAYGFIDSAVFWLLVFVAGQLAVIGLGSVPLRYWRSFSSTAPQRADTGTMVLGASRP